MCLVKLASQVAAESAMSQSSPVLTGTVMFCALPKKKKKKVISELQRAGNA